MKKKFRNILIIFVLCLSPLFFSSCKATSRSKPFVFSLEIKTASRTSDYYAYDQFDDDGLVLLATYSNGSQREVLSGWKISYLSNDGNEHSDSFYAGETKLKISFGEASTTLNVDEVQKIDRNAKIELKEYSHIASQTAIGLPQNCIKVLDTQTNEEITNLNVKLIYCTNFVDFNNYLPTSASSGAVAEGSAPANKGSYKVFAIIEEDQNYNRLYSNVVSFNIIDREDSYVLFSRDDETFFGWKRIPKVYMGGQIEYVEFELSQKDGFEYIKFISNFNGVGETLIFDDNITLRNDDGDLKIVLNNNKLEITNFISLEKWTTQEFLGEYVHELNDDQICKLKLYDNSDDKTGNIYFEFELYYLAGEEIGFDTVSGIVYYSNNDGVKSLSLSKIDKDNPQNYISFLKIDNVGGETITIEFMPDENMNIEMNNGIYQKVS